MSISSNLANPSGSSPLFVASVVREMVVAAERSGNPGALSELAGRAVEIKASEYAFTPFSPTDPRYVAEKMNQARETAQLDCAYSCKIDKGAEGFLLRYRDWEAHRNRGRLREEVVREKARFLGETEAQIQNKLATYQRCGCSERIEEKVNPGLFLHIFNSQKRDERGAVRTFQGVALPFSITDPGSAVFRITV